MGNCVCKQTDEDEAQNALLDGFDGRDSSRPRGPPPPYQVEAPLYAMTEEQRVQLVQRITMIQCLPLGRYDVGEDKKDKKLEESDEIQGSEKKGEKDRECPICMMDFTVGERIRLLPCMHYYHMRCIDDWLMRSYSCPTCMERVDVGMRNTLTSSSTQSVLRRRRRRRRGERGSTSSTASGGSRTSLHGAEGYSKRRENEAQYFPDYTRQERSRVPREQVFEQDSSDHRLCHEAEVNDRQMYLSGQTSGQTSGQYSTGYHSGERLEEASAGRGYEAGGHDHEVQLLNDSQFEVQHLSQDELVYSMDQMTFGDYQVNPRGVDYLSPPVSPISIPSSSEVGVAPTISPPFSPPVFEYHFQYPTPSSPTTSHMQ